MGHNGKEGILGTAGGFGLGAGLLLAEQEFVPIGLGAAAVGDVAFIEDNCRHFWFVEQIGENTFHPSIRAIGATGAVGENDGVWFCQVIGRCHDKLAEMSQNIRSVFGMEFVGERAAGKHFRSNSEDALGGRTDVQHH